MPSFLFVGTAGHDYADADHPPSFHVEPGEAVEADENPDPHWFDLVDGPEGQYTTDADVAPTVTEEVTDAASGV